MARRHKPKTPEQIAAERLATRARNFEAVGLQPEAAGLAASDNIEIIREGEDHGSKKAGHNVAKRIDAFDALKDGMVPGAYSAARKLEEDIAKSRGEFDRGRSMFRVDEDKIKDPIDKMATAVAEVKRALSFVGARDAWLLMELIRPTLACAESGFHFSAPTAEDVAAGGKQREALFGWRAIVAHITAETHTHAQGAVVRSACANLVTAYEARKAA